MTGDSAQEARAPRVSVVLPVYHPDAEHFGCALDSLLGQTFGDFELVIVEADPTDAARAALAARPDPRIRWFRFDGPPNVAAQHNRAIELSRAELVARADADDVCERERIGRSVAYLEEHPEVDVVGSNLTVIDDAGRTIGRRSYPRDHDAIVAAMRRFNPIANSTVMFRRSIFDRCGGWRTDTGLPAQDYDWYSRLAHSGVRFANLSDALVRYRIHGGSLKSTRLMATLRSTLEIKRRHWAREFGLRDRVVYALEHALLLLPPRVVLRLFMAIRYRGARSRQSATTAS